MRFFTQFVHVPQRTSSSDEFSKRLAENAINKNNRRFFEHFDLWWLDELDFNIDICDDFYEFVCQKWLNDHPLSPLEFKRSRLTERSRDIREKFAQTLANLSTVETYNYQVNVKKKPN